QRRDDAPAARHCAEQAATAAPALHGAGRAVLECRCTEGDWDGALDVLDRNMRSGVLDRTTYRRHRAVLLTAQAIAAEESDRDAARSLAIEASKLAPDLVPAAALAGRLLADTGEQRKAARILD